MIAYLRSLASRLMRRHNGPLPPPVDPPGGVREPRTRRPGGRSSAAAVAEPPEERAVRARGRSVGGGSER
jgi:hypothetical protein